MQFWQGIHEHFTPPITERDSHWWYYTMLGTITTLTTKLKTIECASARKHCTFLSRKSFTSQTNALSPITRLPGMYSPPHSVNTLTFAPLAAPPAVWPAPACTPPRGASTRRTSSPASPASGSHRTRCRGRTRMTGRPAGRG